MSPSPFLRLPALDLRLTRIAEQVPACDLAADIGADHGKLSCHLLHSGRVQRMIVSDISPHSRDKARDLFMRHQLMYRVILSGADGLHALQGHQVGAVIIAGMGGGLIARILQQDVELKGAVLLLGAQTELHLVRAALLEREYRIQEELLTQENGRFYRIIKGIPGRQALTPLQLALGFNVQDTPEAAFRDYMRWQLQVTASWQGNRGDMIRQQLKEALHAEENRDGAADL